ncbi:MAG TPA: diguanylate cyclase [Steroidobacteraceae bacterium]|nr:diguanylate cyclase [Steroidobacteraceae bacterium]
MSAQTTKSEPEELAQFLHVMPIAAARFGESGALEMLNPAAVHVLRSLDIEVAGANLPMILDRLGPGLADAWRTSAGRAGAVVPAQQCTALPVKGPAVHLLLRVLRPDARCTMIILDDVTVTVEKERECERQRRRMGLLFEYIHGYCVAMLDEAGTVVEWNPSIGRLFGIQPEAIVGRPLLDRVSVHLEPPTPSANFSDVRKVITTVGWCRVDASWKRGDGQEMWGDCVIAPVPEPDGATGCYVAVIRDVSVEHINTQELIDAALTDPLTGLHNRRGLEGRAEAVHFRPGGAPVTQVWIMVDIDHFKRVNDTYGHEAGDEVLKAVAEALRSTARGADIVARFGGEEFVLVLPDTGAEMALRIAERLRLAIEALSTEVDGQVIRVTASFGVAQRAAQENQLEVLERADAALYESKKGGRNRVTVSTAT